MLLTKGTKGDRRQERVRFMDTKTIIKKLPKVDLHLHLDGSLRVETIRDLAISHKFKLPTEDPEKLAKYCHVSKNCKSLAEFLDAFEFFYPFLKFPDSVFRMAYELCEDMAKDNVVYFETRFAPHLQATSKMSARDVVKYALNGLKKGSKDFGVEFGAILCCYRPLPPETSYETVLIAEKFLGDGVVGIDLAGDESKYKLEIHKKALTRAREIGIPITVHAGEAAPSWSVWDALNAGAKRIGHGVRIREDKKLYQKIIKEKIPLEICLTSNVQTRAVESYEKHPFPEYYKNGIVTVLNTDDPGVSNIDLSYEYTIACKKYRLSIDDLKKIVNYGIQSAFCSDSIKVELSKGIS
ncbi:MAG: adenosine deaminase [Candidatus Hydrogenedentota bacterium]